jgi:pSer/pThr/pTyr-binding forkhead associated (FHA) protein
VKVALVMVKSDGSAKEFVVPTLPVVIGRDERAKFRIPLKEVSRRHAELFIDDGEVMIKDLSSANGSFVNGNRVRETELSAGDLLSIGGVVFVVRIDSKPAKIDAKDCFMAGLVSMEDTGDDLLAQDEDRPTPGGRPLSGLGGGKESGFDDLLNDLDKDLDFGDESGGKKAGG